MNELASIAAAAAVMSTPALFAVIVTRARDSYYRNKPERDAIRAEHRARLVAYRRNVINQKRRNN